MKIRPTTSLQKYLFYRGQIYFQILAMIALVVGTVVLKLIFSAYGVPDTLFKIVLLIGFSLTLLVIALQAYLHHIVILKGVSPVSWLSHGFKKILNDLNDRASSQPANIPALEKEMEKMLESLGTFKNDHQEVKDVTEILRHLIKMLGSYWQAATRNEVLTAMGRISAEVAHDIRGPLSSIQAAIQNLGELKTNDNRLEAQLNLLQLGANRLLGIANNLLTKYRGELEEKGIFSIHHILDELVGECRFQERFNAVKFVKQYHREDLYIEGNKHLIQRLFGNLIKNAAEAMQYAGPITITTHLSDNKIVVKIADTGCGIPPNRLKQVFEGYSEGKKSGHGIGLQFVRNTAVSHGGRVWVESLFGEGSQFYVELPMVSSHQMESQLFTIVSGQAAGPIVVIDDDPSVLEQWRLLLSRLAVKFEGYLSYDGFERVQGKHSQRITVIADYHFDNSEWNGIDIIKKLKEKGFKNLYLCTAEYWKPSLKKQAEELGVAICPKPLPKIAVSYPEVQPACHCEPKGRNPNVTKGTSPDKIGGYTVLVIDDDETIRLAWELMDRKLNIEKLHTFANLETLETACIDLAAVDLAFVDKNILGSQFTGAQVVAYLKSHGVPKVILASGENSGPLRQNPEFALADFIVSEKIPQSFKAFFS